MIASKVLMIEPVQFGFNEETAISNAFQQREAGFSSTPQKIQENAQIEFYGLVDRLRSFGIEVLLVKDTERPFTPDSIFPNNWFSTDSNGHLLTYPMASVNRRAERREDILSRLGKSYVIDRKLEKLEDQGLYLEGTGSMIIDQRSKTAFAALSPRTSLQALEAYAGLSGNKIVSFTALGPEQEAIYHTNVMLCLTDKLAIIGKDTIVESDRKRVVEEVKKIGKELLYLSNEQVYRNFAGNMLQLQNAEGEKAIVMSSKAKRSLTRDQLMTLESAGNAIIDAPLDTIEQIGGGSARCMLAELF